MLKRFICLLLIFTLAVSLSGCKIIEKVINNSDASAYLDNESKTVSNFSSQNSSSSDVSQSKPNVSSKSNISSSSKTNSVSISVTTSGSHQTVKSDNKIAQPKVEKLSDVNSFGSVHKKVASKDYYQYQFLSENGKILYNRIFNAVKNSQSIITVSDLGCNEEESSLVFNVFFADNPQYFYISKTYLQVFDSEGIEIRAIILLYTDGRVTDDYNNNLQLTTTANRDLIDKQIYALQCFMEDVLNKIPADAEDVLKERIIHDYIAEWVTYDEKIAEADIDYDAAIPVDYTIYGAAVERSAVCEGYSKLFQYLCYNVGLNCTLIEGDSFDFLHMWNAVLIDGKWYQIDVTWDDDEAYTSYSYFNLTTDNMERDHKIDLSRLKLPNCISTDKSFLNTFAVYAKYSTLTPTSYKEQVLLSNQLLNKKIHIYINGHVTNPLGDIEVDRYKSFMQSYIYRENCEFMKYLNANNIKISLQYRAEGHYVVIDIL